jgi:hypothetical protein
LKIGIEARRQPGSGIYGDFPHDIEFRVDGVRMIGECKKRAALPKTFDDWLGGADVLFMAPDRSPPARVYMTYEKFLWMLDTIRGLAADGTAAHPYTGEKQ